MCTSPWPLLHQKLPGFLHVGPRVTWRWGQSPASVVDNNGGPDAGSEANVLDVVAVLVLVLTLTCACAGVGVSSDLSARKPPVARPRTVLPLWVVWVGAEAPAPFLAGAVQGGSEGDVETVSLRGPSLPVPSIFT